MNDFLQSIRNGSYSKDNGGTSKPRYNSNNNNSQRPRRAYESNGNGNFMRNGNERKFRPRTGPEGFVAEEGSSTMTTIKDTLQAILTNQEAVLAFAERKAIAEERKADAFEYIASHIGKLSGESFVPRTAPVNVPSPVVKPAVMDTLAPERTEKDAECKIATANVVNPADKQTGSDMNKDEILAVIADMRRDGSTYNEIASHLVDLNLPTFSGRGKWHAQTIHRLCQTV